MTTDVQSKCWSCDILLTTENSSAEHIILNACGGSLKPKTLLCISCNASFGNSYDAELATQVNPIVNYLMIKRDRNEPQPIKGKLDDGTEYKYLADGRLVKSKPEVNIKRNGEKTFISVGASSDTQFNEIVDGLVKKFPILKKNEIINAAKHTKYFLEQPINTVLPIGGPGPFRSLAKTAINYYIYKEGDSKYIKHLKSLLKGVDGPQWVWYYFPETIPYQPEDKEVSHVIHIHGDPQQRILYGYIELFNYMNVLIKLSEDYDGPTFKESYVYDPVNKIEKNAVVALELNRDKLLDYFNNKLSIPTGKLTSRINRVWRIAHDIQTRYHLNKLITEAVLKAIKDIPEGTIITKEIYELLMTKVIADVMPFVEHQNKRADLKTSINKRRS